MGHTQKNVQFSHRIRRAAALLVMMGMGSLLLTAGGCRKEEKAKAPQTPTVEVVAVVQKDIPIYNEWVGILDGSINAVIRPQVAGYLISQNYREGEQVKKGQVLFEIDPRTFQAALNQAKALLSQQKARHDTAKANLARIRPLAEKNAVSQKDLDDAVGMELSAKASVEAAQASIEEAQLNLEFTKITSPVDGIAGIAKTQLGNLVGPSMSEELTSVSTVNPIKAYINISEREYLGLREKSQQVENIALELILADGSTYPDKGKFALADRQINAGTGTLKVGSLFPNPGNILRPGGFGLIRALMEVRKGALLIPQRAVGDVQGKYLVAVVGSDNKVDIRMVKVGERIGSDWIISEGLKPGESVIAEGIQKVKPAMVVNPQPFNPEAAAKAAATKAATPAEKR
ncbi:efflux RND transporter periplasmic adaptor subunit [uncultured Desulfobulbus sp.]|uniref:efflux RND transporter periplasmic adaptor subunit n=1 Tax=uncultured Desulfobulbus sp. TaxID=239745 RepID=UPI0029C5FE32|nr:efflux RND transporter periplasmic adaptor subunit [uncultured Desulfobulbus sp.]